MEANHRSVTGAEPPAADEGSLPGDPSVGAKELAQLAARLRRAVATIDAEARERLDAAWVALTSALKQPQHDAARIAARLSRLRGEVDRILAGQLPGSGSDAEQKDLKVGERPSGGN